MIIHQWQRHKDLTGSRQASTHSRRNCPHISVCTYILTAQVPRCAHILRRRALRAHITYPRKETQSKCILRRTHFPVNIIVHTHILGASASKGAIPTYFGVCTYTSRRKRLEGGRYAPTSHTRYPQTDSEQVHPSTHTFSRQYESSWLRIAEVNQPKAFLNILLTLGSKYTHKQVVSIIKCQNHRQAAGTDGLFSWI